MLRRIFGSKRDEVKGEWRGLHNEELHNLYTSHTIVRVIKSRIIRLTRHFARMGEERGVYSVLVRKAEEKRPLGKLWCRCEDNMRTDLQEVVCGLWTGSGSRQVAGICQCGNKPSGSIK
jgi:hypothetical protein